MSTRRGTWRPIAVAAAGTAPVLVLASCAVLSTSIREDDTPDGVSTDITDEPVTLTLAYTDDPPTEALVEGFHEQYPNVTIEPRQTEFTDYVMTIRLSMSSENPPDIAQYNPGAMGSLIPAGQILDLEEHSSAYGWEDTFAPTSLESLRTNQDATEFATGNLYAVPGALSILGVFYNKELLADAGVDGPPETLDEFEDALAQVQDDGTMPLSVGGLETGGVHLWNAVLNGTWDDEAYRDWVYGSPGSSIETDHAAEATRTVQEWAEAGYLPEGANATSDNDAQVAFAGGESAFLVSGNWAAAELSEEMGDDVGFFLAPGATEGKPPVASGASVSFAVSSQSEHPDVAAAFLDYLRSPEAAQIQLETGFLPADPDAPTEGEGVLGEVNDEFTQVIDAEGLLPFPDWASPGMADELVPGVQGVLAGTTGEEEFLRGLQDEWSAHQE
ncbi:extracellular solute-binding protein [Nocardiopsis sp. HNM0947]|uniref:Extracellular solute-binding protein n=1 Tax=Nocardiopsis coralli TaxID=2772213 RepID=A0ABR9P216_9ACTN|nr:extracellular solute-binding protein [Nocardiopsis coralli]MBE2997891.1 extracellular solute-binding protein [Nocardiopsis coralli]